MSVRPPAVTARAYVSRRPGFVAERRRGRIVLRRRHAGEVAALNATAALVWEMCDGRQTVAQIEARLKALYAGQSPEVGRDVRRGLAALAARALIRVTPVRRPALPLVSLGFVHFWQGFDERDNYFVWMLAHRFDVVLVDPRRETPTFLFHSNHPDGRFDPARIERGPSCKVFCGIAGALPDFGDCDYAFTTHALDEQHAERHQHLPAWALYLEWDDYRRSHGAFRQAQDRLAAAYDPVNVCNRFVESLTKALSPAEATISASRSPALEAPQPRRRAGRAERTSTAKLTIGMATYDDYDGVYFTVQAVRLFHPEVAGEVEFLVVDNNPEGAAAPALQALGDWIDGYRYLANSEPRGTATRDLVFREARTPYAMCVDSHVLLAPTALRLLIDFFDAGRDGGDLLQGPLVLDDLATINTHFDPVWSHGMYGAWGTDPRGLDPRGEPFEIPMQGLGVFACRKDAWPGFNPRFVGFGGEEGYVHEKLRQNGHRTLCLPFLRWSHRFQRPMGTRYANVWDERVRNYFIGWQELGLGLDPIEAHFRQHLGAEAFDAMAAKVRAEMDSPFFFFDAIYCINLDSSPERWQRMQERFERLGIPHRVRRFAAVETPESHHIGCALSHRRIIEKARRQGLANVLVFEDDALFRRDWMPHLQKCVAELRARPWRVFHLGGHAGDQHFPVVPGCHSLEGPCPTLTCTHAVAYHADVYERILDDLPDDVERMREWIAEHRGIDQYLRCIEPRFVSRPMISLQPFQLAKEPGAFF